MSRSWTSWTWSESSEAADLWRLVHHETTTDAVVVLAEGRGNDDGIGERLVRCLDEPLAATVSAIPLVDRADDRIVEYEAVDRLPPPPTLGAPNAACVALAVDVLRAVWREEPGPGTTWVETLPAIARMIVNRGWRHVGAPGLGLPRASIDGAAAPRDGGWAATTIAEIEGPSNESLSTHRLWARTRGGVQLVIDAACLDGGQHNGSQALVANVADALAVARPTATVLLAVEPRNVEAVRASTAPGLEVVARGAEISADVVYRPYQLLVPGELTWLTRTGERLLVGQLDMIGFSNPSYHPSPALFHTVRNLQRRTMRLADGVTFISEFGRRHALAECPDLERDRCFVVSSGASTPTAHETAVTSSRPFVLCLSAVFWHKHRDHAIRTFASMVTDHGYTGDLCIAGPEPFYGRSSDAEVALVASLPAEIRDRVRFLGRVDDSTRWALLAGADVLLYPSVVEGFGMVPFEAAGVGTASLVAPGSALEEVFAHTGAVVGSWDPDEWSARAMEVVTTAALRDEIVSSVMSRAERHSWANVAEATWAAIDAVTARPRARLHHEEGGILARVAPHDEIAISAAASHFANRLAAYGRRRFGRADER